MRAKVGAQICGAALTWLLLEVWALQLVSSSSTGSDLSSYGNEGGNSSQHLNSSSATTRLPSPSIDGLDVAESQQNQPTLAANPIATRTTSQRLQNFSMPSIFSRNPATKGQIRSGSSRRIDQDNMNAIATTQVMSTNLAANEIGRPDDRSTSEAEIEPVSLSGQIGSRPAEQQTDSMGFLVANSNKLDDNNRSQQRGNDRRLIGEKLMPTQSAQATKMPQANKRYEGQRLSMEMDISGSLVGANLDSSQNNANNSIATSEPTKLKISANQTRKKPKEPSIATAKPVVLASDVRVMSNLLLVGNDRTGSEPSSTGNAALDSLGQLDNKPETRPLPSEQADGPSDWFVVSSEPVDSVDSLKQAAKQTPKLDSASYSDKANRASEISRIQGPRVSSQKSDVASILSQLRDQLSGSAAHSRTSVVEIPKLLADLTVRNKAGGFDGSQFAKSTSLGIRVTAGQSSAPLVINNRGLITAAKGRPIFPNNNTVAYNPANTLISQMDYSLSPSDKQSYAAGSAKYKPVWAHLGSDLEDRPSFLKQPIKLSGQQFWADSETEMNPNPNSNSIEDEAQSTKVIQTSVLEAPLDQLSLPAGSNQSDSNSSTFQHNPPYTKLPQHQNNQTEIQPQISQVHRNKTKNHTNQPNAQKPAKRPVIPGRVKPEITSNFPNGSFSTLIGEPIDLSSTTMSSATNEPLAYSDHKPTQLRNKLHSMLLAKLAPPKQNPSSANSSANAQRGSPATSVGSSNQVTPAPLLSSTAAQNLASLLAQGFTQLIQGPSRTGSRFNSLLANRLRRRVNHMSSSKIDAQHSSVNRRSTNVGSLLLSGFIYGLSVLPALMALTGNNPLNGFNLADESSPTSPSAKRATAAINRHGSAARIGAEAERKRKSQKTARAPDKPDRPNLLDSTRTMSTGLDSLLNTYLVQLDPVTTMASPTSDQDHDLKAALKYYLAANGPVANQLSQLHPLLDADSDTDFENLGKSVLISRYSDAASLIGETSKFALNSANDQPIARLEPQKAATSNDNLSPLLADDKQAKFKLRVTEQPDQTAFTPLVIIPIEKPNKPSHKIEAYSDNSNRKMSIDAAASASSRNLDTTSADDIAILGPYDMNPGFEQSLSLIPLESVDLSTATSDRSPKQPANKLDITRSRDRQPFQSPASQVRSNQLVASAHTPSDRIAQMRYKPISGHKTNEQKSGFKSFDVDNSWRISKPTIRRQHQLGQHQQLKFELSKLISAQKQGQLKNHWTADKRKSSHIKASNVEPLMLRTRTKKAPAELRRSSGSSLKSTTKASNGSKKSSSTSVLNPVRLEFQNPRDLRFMNDTVGELLLAHSLAMGSRILNEPYEFKRVRT